jgi:hypothetical protein
MIKVISFSLFQSLLRVTQEFHEEKALVKVKSLTFEREYEFEYKNVREISDAFHANSSQIVFSFWILFFSSLGIVWFWRFLYSNPLFLRIWQAVYISAWLLFLTGFKRSWRIYFSDANDRILTFIKQTGKNQDLIPQIVKLIKKNSDDLQEISAADPFPDENPKFENIDHNIVEMHKTTDRFYDDRIIGFQKGIYGEEVYNIQYNQLSGQVFHGKRSQDVLCFLMPISGLIISMILGLSFGFNISFERAYFRGMWQLITVLLALTFASGLLGLVKREVFGFYGKDGSILYWTYINRTNRNKFSEIVQFVQSRITPEETNQMLKEQT